MTIVQYQEANGTEPGAEVAAAVVPPVEFDRDKAPIVKKAAINAAT